MVSGDFNNDGKADVSGVDFLGNNLRVAYGDGAGGIASVSTFSVGTKPTFIAAGVLNNDGRLDLVATNSESHNVSVLLNNGAGGFARTDYGAGVGPGATVLADFNGDNFPDVALTNQAGNAIVLLLNNGVGGLLPLTFVSFSGRGPKDIVSADFNNDGKMDLATVNNPGGPMTGGDVAVLLGVGNGTFGPPTYFAPPNFEFSNLTSIAAGDFTGDGQLDLVVGSHQFNHVRVMAGNGAGGFIIFPSGISVGGSPVEIVMRDIDSDSKLDVVVALNQSIIKVLLYGDGFGNVLQSSEVVVGSLTRWVTVTDLNGDGRPDIAATFASVYDSGLSISLNDASGKPESITRIVTETNYPAPFLYDVNLDGRLDLVTSGVKVRLGLSNGGFGPPATYPAGGYLTFGDFNEDQRPDIAAAGNGAVSILLNIGGGGFGAATVYGTGTQGSTLVTGDFNSDDHLDIAVAGYNTRSVRVLTGNGMGGFLLTGSFNVGANPLELVVGDFNTDGQPDVVTENVCDPVGGRAVAPESVSRSCRATAQADSGRRSISSTGPRTLPVNSTPACRSRSAREISMATTGSTWSLSAALPLSMCRSMQVAEVSPRS